MRSPDDRPVYHFTPPVGWLNDPNGLVYYEGEYHLFYQADPDTMTGATKAWGHAVSPDLVTWEHLPVALAPDALGLIYSGSAVVDWHDTSGFFNGGSGLVAIFTHSLNRTQRQSIAYSADRGRTWTKYAANPVIADPGYGDFRDPKVFWHAPTARWVMILAARDRVLFYVSTNLREWALASEFGADQGSHAGVWECPDLVELPMIGGGGAASQWMMPVSIGGAGGSAMQYFLGDFDGTTFTNANAADTVLWADYGRDNYAAVSWSDIPVADGRRLWIGWMSNWKYARFTPTDGWRGAMTVPRVLSLATIAGETRLVQTPVVELRALRGEGQQWADAAFAPGTHLLQATAGRAYEIVAAIRPGTATGFAFAVQAGGDAQTVVGYDVNTATLYVDRIRSGDTAFSPDFAGRQDGPLRISDDGTVTLHIFVDTCSVEVFGGSGETVITDLVFPQPASQGLALEVTGGTATVVSLEVYPLG